MTGVLEVLEAAKPRVASETMCIDGELEAQHERLRAELVDAAERDQREGSLAMSHSAQAIEALDAVRDLWAARRVTFEFGALAWTKRLALQAEHPPRPNHIIDARRGWNVETYTRALIRACCVRVVGADGSKTTVPDALWDKLLGTAVKPATEDSPEVLETPGTLSFGQVQRLFGKAMHANDGESEVPPSARSLLTSQDSGASLAQPGPGTSPQSGSEDGNPHG